MYTLKTWLDEWSQPETRHGLPYALAWSIAAKAGYSKAQVVCETFNIIELEVKP